MNERKRFVSLRLESGKLVRRGEVKCSKIWLLLILGGNVTCRGRSCSGMSCSIESCRGVSCSVVSCRVVSCRAVSCRVVCCPA